MTTKLTPYDTGARLAPIPWVQGEARRRGTAPHEDFGKVDFDDDESSTVATLWIERQGDGTYTLKGYTNVPLKIDIDYQGMPGDEPLFITPSAALQARVKEIIDGLESSFERDEASVYWAAGQALILVPGEKGYRKQQAILVEEPGEEQRSGLGWRSDRNYSGIQSAIVKGWASGIRDTRA